MLWFNIKKTIGAIINQTNSGCNIKLLSHYGMWWLRPHCESTKEIGRHNNMQVKTRHSIIWYNIELIHHYKTYQHTLANY